MWVSKKLRHRWTQVSMGKEVCESSYGKIGEGDLEAVKMQTLMDVRNGERGKSSRLLCLEYAQPPLHPCTPTHLMQVAMKNIVDTYWCPQLSVFSLALFLATWEAGSLVIPPALPRSTLFICPAHFLHHLGFQVSLFCFCINPTFWLIKQCFAKRSGGLKHQKTWHSKLLCTMAVG